MVFRSASVAEPGNIEKHGEVVTGASGQYKEMPECMKVRQAVESEEDDSRRVEQTTQRDPEYAMPRDCVQQRAHREHAQPTHSQIHDDRRDRETFYCETLEHNSQDGEAPDNSEQRPTQPPTQRHQGEGSIGSGDQKIDCRMIDDSQNSTRVGADKRVI